MKKELYSELERSYNARGSVNLSVLRSFENKTLPTEAERQEFIRNLSKEDPRYLTARKVYRRMHREWMVTSLSSRKVIADMVFSKACLGYSYKEYMWYDFANKTIAERMMFFPDAILLPFYDQVNTSLMLNRTLRQKIKTYELMKPFFRRDVLFIPKSANCEKEFIEFASAHPRFIIKPNGSTLGKGVHIIDTAESSSLSDLYRELVKEAPAICEELIISHPDIAALYPNAINCVRIFSLFDGKEYQLFCPWLKIGCGGAVVDNAGAGGMLAAIDMDTGKLITHAYDEAGNMCETHPDTGVRFIGFQIPEWKALKETVVEATRMFTDGTHIVGWDFAISADRGWQLVEGNGHGQFWVYQIGTKRGIIPELHYRLRRLDSYSDLKAGSDGNGVLGYRFAENKEKLAEVRAAYELTPPEHLSDQEALAPLYTIPPTRYIRSEDGVYRQREMRDKGNARLLFTGDIMCRAQQQQKVLEKYGCYDFRDTFEYITPILTQADLVMGNLETVVSENIMYTGNQNRMANHALNRNAPATFLGAVRGAGFDGTITANNHCLDGGLTGIYQTLCHLDEYGLMHTGTYFDADDKARNEILHIEVNGIRIAFLSFASGLNKNHHNLKAGSEENFVSRFNKDHYQKLVKQAREEGAELIFCYMHAGTEHQHKLNNLQLNRAQELADMGVDLVIGSHPHVVQKFAYVKSNDGRMVPIAYSLGNFVSSMKKIPAHKDTVILDVRLERKMGKATISSISYIPCYTRDKSKGRVYTVLPLTQKRIGRKQVFSDAYNRIREAIGDQLPEELL